LDGHGIPTPHRRYLGAGQTLQNPGRNWTTQQAPDFLGVGRLVDKHCVHFRDGGLTPFTATPNGKD